LKLEVQIVNSETFSDTSIAIKIGEAHAYQPFKFQVKFQVKSEFAPITKFSIFTPTPFFLQQSWNTTYFFLYIIVKSEILEINATVQIKTRRPSLCDDFKNAVGLTWCQKFVQLYFTHHVCCLLHNK
jgi:hypothetical protein